MKATEIHGESSADLVARLNRLYDRWRSGELGYMPADHVISWPRIAELLTEAAAVQADNETLRGRLAEAEGWFEKAATVTCAMQCGDEWINYQARLAASTPDTARET